MFLNEKMSKPSCSHLDWGFSTDCSISFCWVLAHFAKMSHLWYVTLMSSLSSWPVDCLPSPEVHFVNCIMSMCNTLRVEALSDWGMISLTPLYKIPSLHVISSLKCQYDCVLKGQSLIVLGHPSWTIIASSLNTGSLDVASCISCSLSGLAGVICAMWCTRIFSMLFRLVLQSCGSGFRSVSLKSASAMMFYLPLRYSMCILYCASLINSLCSLGLEVTTVFFHMLVRGWWSVSNVMDFPNV